jgi:DNA-binding NtrC family response regulator
MPGLNERIGDIPLLANAFLKSFRKETGREILGFTEAAMASMQRYNWPGNVRELENAVERAVVLCRRPQIDVEDLPEVIQYYKGPATASGQQPTVTGHHEGDDYLSTPMPLASALEVPERKIIEAALQRNNWNRQLTAAELDINRTTLYKKMRKYRLDVGEMN